MSRSIPSWRSLARLSDDELNGYDVAAVNLACAADLPGADRIDFARCLDRLDGWANAVGEYTDRMLPQFRRSPQRYENSEAYFRALAMITVLQRDLGVRYNPAKIAPDAPFDTADSFIHGVLQGDGGTCATLPVVYAAVGRRLGYPIRLSSTRGQVFAHGFARWDDQTTGVRFNIEAMNRGLSTPPDDYYRHDPRHRLYHLTPDAEREGCYLVSKTPRMELAGFLAARAARWDDARNWWRCVDSWAWAASLVPANEHVRNSLRRAMTAWDAELRRTKPLGFPDILVRADVRLFPDTLPLELERTIFGLTAVHHLLTDPRLETKYWARMRRGDIAHTPTRATATFAPNESCSIDLVFH
ncbi:transglutaminase family protein [Fimbriiglobus ruber]|nr:transglutaminase family protein [Fimbriiglobus ruber]